MPFIRRLLDGAEVEWKPLGEICAIKTGKGITKKDAISDGTYPIISGGKMPMDYIDIYNREANTVTVSRVGANAGFVSYISERFYLNDKCFSIIPKKDNVLIPRFLYYGLKSQEDNISTLQSQGGVPTINTAKLGNVRLPLPPLPVQKEIVRILDKFTTLEAELKAELDCRKRQYEYYRNRLLSFDMLNRGGQKLNNVIWLKMGDIAEIYGGLTGKSKVDFGIGDAYFIPYKNIFDHSAVKLDKLEKVRVDVGERQHNVKYGDVLFTGSSETPEEVGMSSSVTTEPQSNVYLNSFCFGVRFNEGIELMPEFSKFLFRSPIMRRQIYKTASGVTRFNVSKERFKKILIPIPPLSEQQRIVSILDKFDTLTTSISEGLPKEIELRRKQYEYYRNELLSFSKPKVIS